MTIIFTGTLKKGALSALFLFGAALGTADEPALRPGWGVDACLTTHVNATERARYLALLRTAPVVALREREPSAAMGELAAEGHPVLAFVNLHESAPLRPGETLPVDLLEVFRHAQNRQREYGRVVAAWEIECEMDLGYCHDLPDRAVAYHKAVYLGLKSGSGVRATGEEHVPEAPVVVMGALGLPPGPWLERAMKNGLLDYTDAYNFHFYGHAEDMAGVVAAHRAIARKTTGKLPLWITECGMKAVRPSESLNPERRALQAEFIVKTAKEAWRSPDVALFMPFILTHTGDPFALTLDAGKPLPAWEAYANFICEHPWPNRSLTRPPSAPNTVVLQWLPDNATCIPHKVSGGYRFLADGPIRGVMRVYNFSDRPRHGRLTLDGLHAVRATIPNQAEVIVAPMAVQTIAVSFSDEDAGGYVREECSARFIENDGRESRAVFGLETIPTAADFRLAPLQLRKAGAKPKYRMFPKDTVTTRTTSWLGTNGVIVEEIKDESRTSDHTTRLRVAMDHIETDPLRSRLAIARVNGLPEQGFIRVALDRPMDRGFAMCVDLLDRKGQRFTIWENFGVGYFRPDLRDVWLNLQDFHPYFWGRSTKESTLRPADVEEIQLRFYISEVNEPRTIELAFAQPGKRRNP